jgi:hypothetical protein
VNTGGAGFRLDSEIAVVMQMLHRSLDLPRGHAGFFGNRADRRPRCGAGRIRMVGNG